MKNILNLIKIMYKNKKNIFAIEISKIQEAIIFSFFILAIITLSFCIEITIYRELEKINLQDLIIPISILLSTFIIFIISIMNIFSEFYYSKDIEYFLVLPIKNIELLIAKFIIISINPYIISISVFLTTTTLYGIINKCEFSYFLLSIIGTITLPIVPIMTIAILTMIFMYIISINILYKIKKIGYIISLLSGIILAFLIKLLDLKNILYIYDKNNNSLILKIFPSNYFLSVGLYNDLRLDRYIYIFFIIFICLIYIGIFYIITSKIYMYIITRTWELDNKNRKKRIKTHNQIIALIIKDFRIILRNPFFFSNLFIKTFIIPISLFLLIFIGNNINNLIYVVESNNMSIVSILFIILFIESKLNLISVTSISREKDNFFLNKIIPVKSSYHIFSKIILGFLINLLPIILTLIMFKIILNIEVYILLRIFFISIFICFYGSINAFIRNLKFPFLDYEDNKDLISSNSNILYLYLSTIFQTIILLYCTFYFKITEKNLFSSWLILSIIMNIFCFYRLRNIYIDLYEKL